MSNTLSRFKLYYERNEEISPRHEASSKGHEVQDVPMPVTRGSQ